MSGGQHGGPCLKNFHAPSHLAPLFPILCATEAPKSDRRWKPPHADGVRPPFRTNAESLGKAIALAFAEAGGETSAAIDPAAWGTGSYSPTPTIIEAARSLYARHTAHDITRSAACAVNLAVTSAAVARIIALAHEPQQSLTPAVVSLARACQNSYSSGWAGCLRNVKLILGRKALLHTFNQNGSRACKKSSLP